MKILVTDTTGLTGKALVRRLLKDGHQVIGLDYKEGHKNDELRSLGAEIVIGSVADADIVRRCMQGVDIVQHTTAAFVCVAKSASSPADHQRYRWPNT